ncbi:MAG: chemotaxis protein CheB [Acidiferrobacter sp.]
MTKSKASPRPRSQDASVRAGARPLIAGIGASAGGLEAFTQLLQHLPTDTGMGFVLVQHLDPGHESALTQILSRVTKMPVHEADNNLAVAPNHVYIIAPNTDIRVVRGVLKTEPRAHSPRPHHSIDTFFESMAADLQERAIGIVLSGTASDGAVGLEAIKAANGITIAQDGSAKYESMPRSAIASGCVDLVLAPDAIAAELVRIAHHPYVFGQHPPAAQAVAQDQSAVSLPPEDRPYVAADSEVFGQILLLLRNRIGVDLSEYKPNTLERRIARRMVLAGATTAARYLESLLTDPEEVQRLYVDLLISVTEFFRNPEVFEKLEKNVVAGLMTRQSSEPIRVWVPGCGTGQEAYSLAMLFMECAGDHAPNPALQIFATDINDSVLDKGRAGYYTQSTLQNVSPERLKRFFVEEPLGHRVSKELRQLVVFARQNLLTDPPFSRIDLVSCRNLLIYLEPALQEKALLSIHYALKDDGRLLLGVSESIGRSGNLFSVSDKKLRLYSKKVRSAPLFPVPRRVIGASVPKRLPALLPRRPTSPGRQIELSPEREADRVTFKYFAPPGVLVDANFHVKQFRGPTSPYLNPPAHSAGFALLTMAAENLLLPLRAALEKAQQTLRPARQNRVPMDDTGRNKALVDIAVIPLSNLKDLHYLVVFQPSAKGGVRAPLAEAEPYVDPDATRPQEHKRSAPRRIATLENKLREALDYISALQTHDKAASAEAQATNEEAASANEELQSMNEELETSKEELQSTNEELITVNEEMVSRNSELNHLNADLLNLHLSINLPILVLGHDLVIRHFTPPAESLFNLMAGDVGRPFRRLHHNLVGVDIEQFISDSVESVRICEREVQDKHGRWYTLRVRPYVTLDKTIQGAVVVLIDIDDLKRSIDRLTRARDYSEAILRAARGPLLVLGRDMRVNAVNDAFCHLFKIARENVEGHAFFELSDGAWNIPKLRGLIEDILPRNSFFDDLEINQSFPIIGKRMMHLSGRPLDYEEGLPQMALVSIDDITAQYEGLKALRTSENRFRRLFDTAQDGILLIDPLARKIMDANPSAVSLLGTSLDALLGRELWEVGLLKDEPSSHAVFRELQKQGSVRLSILLKDADTNAGERPIEFLGNIYLEGGCEVIQCNLRDIGPRAD